MHDENQQHTLYAPLKRFDEENLFEHYSDGDDDDDFIQAELRDQQQLRSQQDPFRRYVGRFNAAKGHAIADELDEHNRPLDDLDGDIADIDIVSLSSPDRQTL